MDEQVSMLLKIEAQITIKLIFLRLEFTLKAKINLCSPVDLKRERYKGQLIKTDGEIDKESQTDKSRSTRQGCNCKDLPITIPE